MLSTVTTNTASAEPLVPQFAWSASGRIDGTDGPAGCGSPSAVSYRPDGLSAALARRTLIALDGLYLSKSAVQETTHLGLLSRRSFGVNVAPGENCLSQHREGRWLLVRPKRPASRPTRRPRKRAYERTVDPATFTSMHSIECSRRRERSDERLAGPRLG
jgi:hypothetical protein